MNFRTARSTLASKGMAEDGIMGVCTLEPLSPALSHSKLLVVHSVLSFICPHEKKN